MAAPPGYSRFIEDGTIEKKAIDWIELNLEDRRLLNRAFLCQRHLPEFNLKDIREIEGVRAADARIAEFAVLDVPGREETVTARILSLMQAA